jgi:hypothetical protein
MALIWADFPSGQLGLYGTTRAYMVNGIWAELMGDTSTPALVADPDPNVGSAGVVLRTDGGGAVSRYNGLRFAFPTPAKTEGGGVRLWMSQLPTAFLNSVVFQWRNASNANLFALRVQTNGAIEAWSGGLHTSGLLLWDGSQYGSTDGPVLVANAYNHIEWKVFSDAASGTIEVRVNGVVVLDLDGLNTDGADIAQFVLGGLSGGSGDNVSTTPYWKDLVLWDTTGSEVNDFQGSVAVHDLLPDGDDALNWTPSTSSTGFNLIDDNSPSNLLTSSGVISNGEQVQIDGVYYNWTSGSVDTGTPAGSSGSPWLVALGGDAAASIANLFNAINASGTAGTTYSTALTAHPTVTADGYSATALNIEATDGATAAISCTETGANLAWTASTLTGGPTDLSYISADDTPPAASIFGMTDLPEDVTSVRAVMSIGRMAKTDGGDCDVQMSLSPDGTNWDTGADRPITTAFTYWWDTSHVSPATSAAWTPAEVDALEFRIDRTL